MVRLYHDREDLSMPLPLNLAMTPLEIASTPALPEKIAWMACHFCEQTEGIANIPEKLPEGVFLGYDGLSIEIKE